MAEVMTRPVGKVRSPFVVLILLIVTFGLYGFVYHYSTFEELRNWRGQGWSGMLYLIFQFLLPPVTIAVPWLIPAYIGRMYAEDGQTKPITGLSGFWLVLPFLGGIIWLLVCQYRMNEFWEDKMEASRSARPGAIPARLEYCRYQCDSTVS